MGRGQQDGKQRGQWQRWGDSGKGAGPLGFPLRHEITFFSVYTGQSSLMLSVSPMIQPLAPSLILPTFLSALSWAADPASVHRSGHPGEGRGPSWLSAERPAVGSGAEGQVYLGSGCYYRHIQCISGFLPVLACPPSPALPFVFWGSTHHLPAPSREIATIRHDQQSPSSITGRAVHFRTSVASVSERDAVGVSRLAPTSPRCHVLPLGP